MVLSWFQERRVLQPFASPVKKVLSSIFSSDFGAAPSWSCCCCCCMPELQLGPLPSPCRSQNSSGGSSITGASCCQLSMPAATLSNAATSWSCERDTNAALLAAASPLLGVAASGIFRTGTSPAAWECLVSCAPLCLLVLLWRTTCSPSCSRSCRSKYSSQQHAHDLLVMHQDSPITGTLLQRIGPLAATHAPVPSVAWPFNLDHGLSVGSALT